MTLSFGTYSVHVTLKNLESGHLNYTYASLSGGNLNNGALGFKVVINGKELKVTSDLIGGYKIYYWQQGDDIYISDDIYEVLIATEKFEIDTNDLRYFERHGYLLCDRTFRRGLYRLSPCSTLVVNEKGLTVASNWTLGNVIRQPDERKYVDAVRSAVDESLGQLQGAKEKIILCFSGGTDSLYLAKRMMALSIDFDIVFWTTDHQALKTAKKGAKLINKDLIVIDVSDYSKELQKVVSKEMFFDKHYSRIHYVGCQKIVEKYGSGVILVNGQNSDSILTYGPSETKFTSYWKRYFMYGENYFIKWIYKTIIEIGFRRRFIVPKTEGDMNRALLDNFKYCLILDKNEPSEYQKYLDNFLKEIKDKIFFSNQNNLWMYIKTITHITGSDTQVCVNSARHFGFQLLLPFATENFMRAALAYKDDRKELQMPKYVLKNDK